MDSKREFATLSAVIVEGMRSVSKSLIETAPAIASLSAPPQVLDEVSAILARLADGIPETEAEQAALAELDAGERVRIAKAHALAAKVESLLADSRSLADLVRRHA